MKPISQEIMKSLNRNLNRNTSSRLIKSNNYNEHQITNIKKNKKLRISLSQLNKNKILISKEAEMVKKLSFELPINTNKNKNMIKSYSCDNSIRQRIDDNLEITLKRRGINKLLLPQIQNLSRVKSDWIDKIADSQKGFKNSSFNINKKVYDTISLEKNLILNVNNAKLDYKKVKDKKSEIENLIIKELKRIKQLEVEIDLTSYKNKNYKNFVSNMNNKNDDNNKRCNSNSTFDFEIKSRIIKEHNARQDLIETLKKDKETCKTNIENYQKEIVELKNELKTLKLNVDICSNKLMEHYEKLLYEGLEVRQEGLIWIIKSIWNLGKNVPIDYFPTFLDIKSINYLFNYAKLSLELNKNKDKITEIKNNLKNCLIDKQIITESITNTNNNENNNINTENKNNKISDNNENCIFTTSIFPKIKKEFNSNYFLNKFNKKNSLSNLNNLNPNSVNKDDKLNNLRIKILNKKSRFDTQINSMINEIKNLNTKINEIEINMNNIRKQEMDRIFKEFYKNQYEKKYNVCIEVIIAALVGDYYKNEEINRYSKKKKQYFDDLKEIQFFNVLPSLPRSVQYTKSNNNLL